MTATLFLTLLIPGVWSSGPSWDGLKVHWANPVSPTANAFEPQPRTTQEATQQGYVKISDCDTTANWRGARYIKDNDYSLILLYDVNGYIAGIQTAVDKSVPTYPSSKITPPFVSDGDRWVISAYFVDPDIICTTGRTAAQFNAQGTGNRVLIQNSADFSNMMSIPINQDDVKTDPNWVEGKCFFTMGQHYWYKISDDMDCDDFFPVFILYNSNKLNALGWAMETNLSSPHLEHPDFGVFGMFMKSVPKCLKNVGKISTMHIYLTSSPRWNFC